MRIAISVSRTDVLWSAAHAELLAVALNARGHDVHVLCDTQTQVACGGSDSGAGGEASFWQQLRQVARHVRFLRKHDVQLMYRHAEREPWALRCAARLMRVPIVSSADARNALRVQNPGLELCVEAAAVIASRLELVFRSTYVKFSRLEIPVLCYHRLVSAATDGGMFATHLRVELFEQQLRFLRDEGYRTLHFADFDSAQTFDVNQRAVILTFDDGYEDNYTLLFPLLKAYGAKAVIYLVSGCDENQWDTARGERSLDLMSHAQCAEMLASGLVEFGAHSVTHGDLSAMTSAQAVAEVKKSKATLEASLGVVMHTFAYPYGRLNRSVKGIVRRAGFRYGIATDSGPLAMHENPFHIRRIVVFPNTTIRRFRRKVNGGYTFYRAPEPSAG